jgi:hypothetical protein
MKKQYSYSVSELAAYPEDEIQYDGSGPASYVADNLRRLADIIDPPETIKEPKTIHVGGRVAYA